MTAAVKGWLLSLVAAALITALLDALTPETAVISVGSNSYGHPTDETLRRLAEHSCAIYRTDMQGTIHLSLN